MASLTPSSSMVTSGTGTNKKLVVPHVVTLLSKQSKYIQETIKGPANATLKSLKIWMVKKYPLLPHRFCFIRNGKRIPEDVEQTMTFEELGNECYIRPYIPEPEKEEEMQQSSNSRQSPKSQNNSGEYFPHPRTVGSPSSAPGRPNSTPNGKRVFDGGVNSQESPSMYSSFVTDVPLVKPKTASQSSKIRPGSLVEASMSAEKLGIIYGSPTGLYQPTILSTRLNPNNPEPIWNDPPSKAAARVDWTPPVEPLFSRVTGRNHLSFPDLCPNRPCHEKKKTKVIRRILKEREKTQRLLAVELEKSYQSTATGNSIITLGKMERDAGEKRESLKRLERQKYEKRRQQQQQRQQQI